MRYGWFGERWVEILDHSPDAVVMDYAQHGLPLLRNHWVEQQVGLIDPVRLEDRKLRGPMRFSRSPLGAETEQDVRDGIRKNASIGYRVLEVVLERSDKENGVDYYRVTKWCPMEGSIVGVPADISVGVGRSAAGGAEYPVTIRTLVTGPTAQERTVETNATPPAGAPTVRGGDGPSQPPINTALEITRLAKEHAFMDDVPGWLERSASLETVKSEIIAKLKERMGKQDTTPKPLVELSPKEARRYSYARAILGACDDEHGVDDGFEREVAQEIRKKLPKEYSFRGGVLLPTMLQPQTEETARADFIRSILRTDPDKARAMLVRAGLDSITATKGSELKFTQPGEFIPMLRNKMKLAALGARLLSGLTGPVSFPKQTNAASGSWVAENPGSDVADSNLLLTTVTLAIKTYMASTSFSRQLLVSALSASVDAEQMVREDLVAINALALDLAGINGSGASNQPRGILNTSGVGLVAIGTNGGAPLWDHIVDLETAVADANADVDTMGYLTTPGIRGKLKKTQQLSATTGVPVWGPGPNPLNGYVGEVSNQVPKTLVKGTSSDCHAVIFGAYSQCVIGEWGALELIVDPFRLKKQAMIEVTSYVTSDVALRYPEAFAKLVDARVV